jgi:hypothetical protein
MTRIERFNYLRRTLDIKLRGYTGREAERKLDEGVHIVDLLNEEQVLILTGPKKDFFEAVAQLNAYEHINEYDIKRVQANSVDEDFRPQGLPLGGFSRN